MDEPMPRCIAPILLLMLPGISPSQESLFDPDPKHVWNQLHRHLHTRTTPDGKLYDQEGLEPVLVRRSRFLTDGESHQQALTLLDEFLIEQAEGLIKDPLKR